MLSFVYSSSLFHELVFCNVSRRLFYSSFCYFLSKNVKNAKVVTRDLPGGNRIRIINMRAQHINFNKAIRQ